MKLNVDDLIRMSKETGRDVTAKAYIDGLPIDKVVEADEEKGYVEFLRTDLPFINECIQTRILRGPVRILLSTDQHDGGGC